MNKATLNKFRAIIHETCGIALSPQKSALVSSRIAKRMRALELESHEEYLTYLTGDLACRELSNLIDAISTNVTSFFRDAHQFEFLEELLRAEPDNARQPLRIWCAAASTGQEPFTIAMTVLQALGSAGANTKILATDISTKVLDKCRAGIYEEKDIKSLPRPLLNTYFDRIHEGDGTVYRVRDDLRRMTRFARLNLIEMPLPVRGSIDAIFCRNVMIYFDKDTRIQLMGEFERLLKPGGHLFVGSSEGLVGVLTNLKTVRPSIYVKR